MKGFPQWLAQLTGSPLSLREGTSTLRGGEREAILVKGLTPMVTGLGVNVVLGYSWPRSNVNVKTYQVHFESVAGSNEIMISPRLNDPKQVAVAMFEALADFCAGAKANNKIRQASREKLGLKNGRPTRELAAILKTSVEAMADLPKVHVALNEPTKEATRLVKCSCDNVADHVTLSGDEKAGAFILRLSQSQVNRVKSANDGKMPCMICGGSMVVDSEVEAPAALKAVA